MSFIAHVGRGSLARVLRLDPVRVIYYEAPLNDHEFFGINFSTNEEDVYKQIEAALDAAVVMK
jgi:hypothetical protein